MHEFISAILFVVSTSMVSHYLIKRRLTPWKGNIFFLTENFSEKALMYSDGDRRTGHQILARNYKEVSDSNTITGILFEGASREKLSLIGIRVHEKTPSGSEERIRCGRSVGFEVWGAVNDSGIELRLHEPIKGKDWKSIEVVVPSMVTNCHFFLLRFIPKPNMSKIA